MAVDVKTTPAAGFLSTLSTSLSLAEMHHRSHFPLAWLDAGKSQKAELGEGSCRFVLDFIVTLPSLDSPQTAASDFAPKFSVGAVNL